jgi:lipopolysaccharide export system permease protein
MKLWRRYFFREIFKVFAFFLFCFFFLYAILDFSVHMDDFFKDHRLQIQDLAEYYGHHFLKRTDFLLPLSLLIATIKVLTTFNTRREWMVLQAAGLPTRTLLTPFFVVGLLCAAFNYANFEFFLPNALVKMDEFHASHFKSSHRAKRKELIHLLTLKDNSKLIYQSYDKGKDAFFDVLWVRSPDDIWRMKFLSANPETPNAQYVDHLTRSKDGFLEKVASHETFYFSDLKWKPTMTGKSMTPFESRSLKELFRLKARTTIPYEIPKISTQLCYKCAIPLLSLLVVLGVAPFCLRFSRYQNLFFVYALALFGLLALYTLMDGAVVLGEYAVLSPIIAIFAPLVITTIPFTWKFVKTL